MMLVTGATGNNGRALLPLLAAAGVRVRAFVQPVARGPHPAPNARGRTDR